MRPKHGHSDPTKVSHMYIKAVSEKPYSAHALGSQTYSYSIYAEMYRKEKQQLRWVMGDQRYFYIKGDGIKNQ